MRDGFRHSVYKICASAFVDFKSEIFEIRQNPLEVFALFAGHVKFERDKQRLFVFDSEIFNDSVVQNALVCGVLVDEINKIAAFAYDVRVEDLPHDFAVENRIIL